MAFSTFALDKRQITENHKGGKSEEIFCETQQVSIRIKKDHSKCIIFFVQQEQTEFEFTVKYEGLQVYIIMYYVLYM